MNCCSLPTRLAPQSGNPCPNNQSLLRGQTTRDNVNGSSRTMMMVSSTLGAGIATCDLPMTGWQSSLTSLSPRQVGPTDHLTSLPSTRNCSLARAMNNLGRPRNNGRTRSLSSRLPLVVEILRNLCPRLERHLLSLCRMCCVSRACHALSGPQLMPWLLIMVLMQSYRKSLNAIRVLKGRKHHPHQRNWILLPHSRHQ